MVGHSFAYDAILYFREMSGFKPRGLPYPELPGSGMIFSGSVSGSCQKFRTRPDPDQQHSKKDTSVIEYRRQDTVDTDTPYCTMKVLRKKTVPTVKNDILPAASVQ
jgi:hypothetical protein